MDFGGFSRQRRTTTPAQIATTTPNDHAPRKKPSGRAERTDAGKAEDAPGGRGLPRRKRPLPFADDAGSLHEGSIEIWLPDKRAAAAGARIVKRHDGDPKPEPPRDPNLRSWSAHLIGGTKMQLLGFAEAGASRRQSRPRSRSSA